MATTFCVSEKVTECVNSPRVTLCGINSTMTREFDINATGINAAMALLKAAAYPLPTLEGVQLTGTPTLRLEPRYSPASGVGVYRGTVEYRHAGRDEQTTEESELIEPDREKVTASFSGETQQITTAISQRKYPANAADMNRAINVQSNGEVEGTDVYRRTGSFTVSTVVAQSIVDNDWLKARFKQIWTVNDAVFRSWPKGDVALVGMDVRQRSNGDWEVDYSFQISPGLTGLKEWAGVDMFPGDNTTEGYFEGWEYVWVKYRPKEGTEMIEPEPLALYAAQVYQYSDFSQLGISV